MSRILKSLQFVTQSTSPSTPSTGTGALFGSGSSFYFENSSGTVFDLAASNGYIVTRSYTGSTTGVDVPYTWSKLPNLKYLEICCVGGGGGGGGGRITNSNNRAPSSGGGGGAIVWYFIEAERLTASPYTITVGRGGTPGSARVTNGVIQDGTTGSNGGDTSFGTLVVANGGQGGQLAEVGSTINVFASGGAAASCTPSFGPWAMSGVPSSMGSTNNFANSTPREIFNRTTSPSAVLNQVTTVSGSWGSGGGGGGNGSGRLTLFTAAVSGSALLNENNGGTPGAINTAGVGGNGGNGVSNRATDIIFRYSGSTPLTAFGLGTGGGGGGGGTTGGGNGGNAGYYGAGGGSGGLLFGLGSIAVPSSSGAGGSGSSGLCLLIEYY
jgi:hypothetical protein